MNNKEMWPTYDNPHIPEVGKISYKYNGRWYLCASDMVVDPKNCKCVMCRRRKESL